ncbi:MAG: aminopeptidase P family protein, partial [Hyphomicrobiales bacterium]|nr:aminopeptidase P family protein [Hyphomicrobiales bacterium]
MLEPTSPKFIEFSSRCDRIRQRMQAEKIDGLFIMQPMNVWYVSGFWEYVPIRIEAVLIPAQGECVFIVSKNEHEYAVKTSWIEDIRYYTEFPEKGRHQNAHDLIADGIRDRHLEESVIGIEEDFMPVSDFLRLKKLLPRVDFVDGSHILKRCRMVKSAYEVDLLKKAGKVACAGWHASLAVAKVGMPEYEIGQAAREAATRTAAA